MNKIEKSWLAGVVDGEGCLTITKCTRKRKGKNYVEYSPVIVISNTDLALLEHIQDLCAYGRIYDREHVFPNAKLQHALHIYRKGEVLTLCRQIIPYLYLKQKQAKILIEAWQVSNEDREPLYNEIHALNKKGEN